MTSCSIYIIHRHSFYTCTTRERETSSNNRANSSWLAPLSCTVGLSWIYVPPSRSSACVWPKLLHSPRVLEPKCTRCQGVYFRCRICRGLWKLSCFDYHHKGQLERVNFEWILPPCQLAWPRWTQLWLWGDDQRLFLWISNSHAVVNDITVTWSRMSIFLRYPIRVGVTEQSGLFGARGKLHHIPRALDIA